MYVPISNKNYRNYSLFVFHQLVNDFENLYQLDFYSCVKMLLFGYQGGSL